MVPDSFTTDNYNEIITDNALFKMTTNYETLLMLILIVTNVQVILQPHLFATLFLYSYIQIFLSVSKYF